MSKEITMLDGGHYKIEYSSGTKVWCLDGKLHRADGPAVEFGDGTKYWCLDGKLHRTDGPAVEWRHDDEWYIDGKEYTEAEYKEITK